MADANQGAVAAGAAAEAHYAGRDRDVDWGDDGYRDDVVQASRVLYDLSAHDDEGAAYFEWIAECTKSLVAKPLFVAGVDALAKALIEWRALTGEEAAKVVHAIWKG